MIGIAILGRRRLILLCLGFVALLAAAATLGWQNGAIAGKPAAPPRPIAWSLPQSAARDPAGDLAMLEARHPWGGRAAFRDIDAGPPPAQAPWHLAGIVERGDERLAMIFVGIGPAAKLEYRSLGENLPDGSVLVQIGADSATSERGKSSVAERRVYRLFEKAH